MILGEKRFAAISKNAESIIKRLEAFRAKQTQVCKYCLRVCMYTHTRAHTHTHTRRRVCTV